MLWGGPGAIPAARLTRFYAENFKCLQSFTLEFDAFTLLVGPNGSGKTTVLEAIRCLTDLLAQRNTVDNLFPTTGLTRWDTRTEQLFELDVRFPQAGTGQELIAAGLYSYRLRVSHDRLREKNRIVEEKLTFEGRPLYLGRLDTNDLSPSGAPTFKAQLYRDNGSAGPQMLGDWLYSGIPKIPPRAENRLLQRFRRFFEHAVVLGINPDSVSAETRTEQPMISFNGSNFAGWLLHLLGAEGLACREAERSLVDGMLPELALFQLPPEGALKTAIGVFKAQGVEMKLRLDELSAGQRAMIILEHALAVARAWRSLIVIDEPANFLGLSEIQPLLHRIHDAAADGQLQAVITSHHPVSLDLYAEQAGRWLERTALGTTRCRRVSTRIESVSDSAIPLSELVARGWVQTPAPAGAAGN
ncbi:MAG: AAA family ATPase [Verrucomicrobiales bacterium]|nr:AAA family ATPase [Verrucomicrobiales bacterium]